MSRIGKKPIDVPQGVEITINGSDITIAANGANTLYSFVFIFRITSDKTPPSSIHCNCFSKKNEGESVL